MTGKESASQLNSGLTQFNRREFLKLVTLGLGYKVSKNLSERLPVIFNRESLGPFSQIKPYMRFADHNLEKGAVKPNTTVVAGELAIHDLYRYHNFSSSLKDTKLLDYYPKLKAKKEVADYQRLAMDEELHISTTSTEEELNIHDQEINQAARQGSEIIACDDTYALSVDMGRVYDAYNLGNERFIHFAFPTLCGGGILLANLIFEVASRGESISPGIKAAASVLLGSETPGLISYQKRREMVVEAMHGFEKIVVGLDQKDLSYLYKNIEIRNKAMALNLHIGQRILDRVFPDGPKEKFYSGGLEPEIFFYAGSGHTHIKSDYNSGIKNLTYDASILAGEIISHYYFKIKDTLNNHLQELAEDLIFWLLSASAFTSPLGSFMAKDEYLNMEDYDFPFSPRALLWQTFMSIRKINPDDEVLNHMAQALVIENQDRQNRIVELYPGLKDRFSSRPAQEQWNLHTKDLGDYTIKVIDGIPYFI